MRKYRTIDHANGLDVYSVFVTSTPVRSPAARLFPRPRILYRMSLRRLASKCCFIALLLLPSAANNNSVRQSSSSSTSRPVRRQSCASVASGTSSARASNSDFPSAPMTRSQDLSSVHLREDGRLKATAFKRSLVSQSPTTYTNEITDDQAPTSIEAHQFPVKRSRPLSTTPAIAESSSPVSL